MCSSDLPIAAIKLGLAPASKTPDLMPSHMIEPADNRNAWSTGTAELPASVEYDGEQISLEKFMAETKTNAFLVIKDGKWARSTVGAIMARQNGKTHALRMRILAGLYVFGEKNIIAISQSRMLSLDTFRQVVDMAEGTAWTRKRIKRVSRTNGQEELEIYCEHYPKACKTKCERIRKYSIKAATTESPRGSTADLLWIDELREINQATWAAATPLTRARPNAQTWVTSNAGDDSSTVLNELRQRALTFSSERLGWYEWSAATNDVLQARIDYITRKVGLELLGQPIWDALNVYTPDLQTEGTFEKGTLVTIKNYVFHLIIEYCFLILNQEILLK